MEKCNNLIARSSRSFTKLWVALLPIAFCALFGAQGALAQGGSCNQISFNFVNYEPCKFRLTYNNMTDCYTDILVALSQGDFQNFSANMPAGFSVEVFGQSQLRITHVNGFLPLGNQAPLIFTLPVGLVTSAAVAYNDQCGMVGCNIFPGPILESCPDPMNASIIGVKYRECGSLPYTNQPIIPDWTIQLLNSDGNVVDEQVTDADGAYAFYDLPLGNYVVREAMKPGWTPSVPASGMVAIDLAPSEQKVANFGNCPGCSCDSIYMNVVQLPIDSDTCAYNLSLSNNGAYCFRSVSLSLVAGQFTTWAPPTGWTAVLLDPQHLRLDPPNSNWSFSTATFKVSGSASHQISVSTSYNIGGGNISCSRSFSFTCPPAPLPPPCCPAGSTFGPELVKNPDFQLGNQDFTNSYIYFTPGGPTMIGKYSVLQSTEVFAANSQWACTDHTSGSTTGKMLIIDGYGGTIAWQQTVNVTAGTNYSFSAWFNNLVIPTKNYDDPQVALFVGGTMIAGPLNFAEIPDVWVRLCGTWTAMTTGSEVLSIHVLANTSIGNDFAVDDISFRACIPPPTCSCNDIQLSIQPISNNIDVCCYQIDVQNASQGCFPFITLFVDAGLFITSSSPLIGWTVVPNGPQSLEVHWSGGPLPTGTYSPLTFCVAGGSVHNIFVGTSYSSGGNQVDCDNFYTYYCLPSDTCYCKANSSVTLNYDGTSNKLPCNLHGVPALQLPCPTGPVNLSSDFGCIDLLGNPCPTSPIDWALYGPNGLIQQGAFPPNTPPSWLFNQNLFTATGTYSIRMTTLCLNQQDSCVCMASWIFNCDTCCQDFDTFCQNFENNVSVSVDNIECKASITIGNLSPCDSIAWINWGQGQGPQQGQYGAGAMPMHVYGQSGTYVISYSAFEYDQFGQICFEKVFQDTIILICDTCSCDDDSWDLEIRFGGALNQPVHCGDVITLPTNGFFVFYSSFLCQGPPECMPAIVEWQLNGPNLLTGGTELALPGFTIPALSPANFTDPGMYMLQMKGICGTDTCYCQVKFCLPPPPPVVHDTSICRTLSSAYIPLYDCPVGCTISQVQWFVKPCSSSTWPTTPYQVSQGGSGLNCSDLLLLPYKYPNETCVQVYAVITLGPGCCVTTLTSNIATITLCNPIRCTITNPNLPYCDVGTPQQLTAVLTGANCTHTVEWFDENNQPVATGLTYTPPVLTFPTGSNACYHDFVFTVKTTGICGTSFCSTSIRVYNSGADNGDIIMNPFEPQPFCPGEDATLEYKDKCSGPPPKWTWYSSIVSGSGFLSLQGAGMMNGVWNTNQLYQTTWYMVESMNGVCPPKQEVYKIEVKAPLAITSFTAIPDPCADSYVNLMVQFTPPQASAGCNYVVDWYWNGDLIGQSTLGNSPVSYTYNGNGSGSVAGVYYAVVHDDCCPGAVQTAPVIIDPTCVPVIAGPCFICGFGPIKLDGVMVLPPKDPCPNTSGCTYQWFEVGVPGVLGTGTSITLNHGGTFIFESNCNGCVRQDQHTVVQCAGTDCITPNKEITLPANMEVKLFPNPTNGAFTLQISPAPLKQGRVEVIRLDGKVLLSEDMAANEMMHLFALPNVAAGLYFVRVYESGFLLWTGKIVKAE